MYNPVQSSEELPAEAPADPRLTALVEAWPTFPDAVRAVVVAMVAAEKGDGWERIPAADVADQSTKPVALPGPMIRSDRHTFCNPVLVGPGSTQACRRRLGCRSPRPWRMPRSSLPVMT